MLWHIKGLTQDGTKKTIKIQSGDWGAAQEKARDSGLVEIFEPLWCMCPACRRFSFRNWLGLTGPCRQCKKLEVKRLAIEKKSSLLSSRIALLDRIQQILITPTAQPHDIVFVIQEYERNGLVDAIGIRINAYQAYVSGHLLYNESLNDNCERIRFLLGLTTHQTQNIDGKIQRGFRIAQLERGEFSPVIVEGLVLHPGETGLLSLNGVKVYQEQIVSRKWVGGSSGITLFDHGLAFSLGQSEGEWVTQRGAVCVADGLLILTTLRLIISGKHSLGIPWTTVLRFNPTVHGAEISSSVFAGGQPSLFCHSDAELLNVGIRQVMSLAARINLSRSPEHYSQPKRLH